VKLEKEKTLLFAKVEFIRGLELIREDI